MGTVVIKIYGCVSSGKSPFAEKLAQNAADRGLSVEVFDHRLWIDKEDYEEKLFNIEQTIKTKSLDIAIVTVGTGYEQPFSIEVTPNMAAMFVHDVIFQSYGRRDYNLESFS